ncbi:hypothetical protein D9M68_937660 [compost metagenome]
MRDHQHAALGVAEHEGQLALAEDRHQRVEDRADTHAGQVQGGHLPPVGQLAGHHIGFFHAEADEAGGHAGDDPVEFAVAQCGALVFVHPVGDQCGRVGAAGYGLVEVICNDHVIPGA